MHSVAIIGGGASGLMAAITASRHSTGPVLLLEGQARVGRKLLATGNGRCNLLNLHIALENYHGSGAHTAFSLLSHIPPKRVLATFESLGLHCRQEEEGRVYPYSGQSGAVLDALRAACARQRVEIRCSAEILRITPDKDTFSLLAADGSVYSARRVILAAGGKAAPVHGAKGQAYSLLSSLGHSITPTFPALSPLRLPPDRIRGLKGVRLRCSLQLYGNNALQQKEQGEALFTEYGISGIASMQLAREAGVLLRQGAKVSLSLSLLDTQTAALEMDKRLSLYGGLPLESFFTGLLHSRITLCLLRDAGLSSQALATADTVSPLGPLLTDWRLPVLGVQSFEHAQVTAGGASLDDFDPQTLASRLCPGLYACGEALDVDGDCGGYNLLWAWASGMAAGEAAASSLSS